MSLPCVQHIVPNLAKLLTHLRSLFSTAMAATGMFVCFFLLLLLLFFFWAAWCPLCQQPCVYPAPAPEPWHDDENRSEVHLHGTSTQYPTRGQEHGLAAEIIIFPYHSFHFFHSSRPFYPAFPPPPHSVYVFIWASPMALLGVLFATLAINLGKNSFRKASKLIGLEVWGEGN